jgi:hypothetical protein
MRIGQNAMGPGSGDQILTLSIYFECCGRSHEATKWDYASEVT